jgi:DNA polymerase III subunit chi
MTRVDFYILRDTGASACALFACRLTEKAVKQGHQVYINAESAAQLLQLDDLLWTFRAGSFLPHAVDIGEDNGASPVLLAHDREPGNSHDVLVNLSNEVPPFFSRFNRVAELVGGNDAQRSEARNRYRYYKDRGYTLHTHQIG